MSKEKSIMFRWFSNHCYYRYFNSETVECGYNWQGVTKICCEPNCQALDEFESCQGIASECDAGKEEKDNG